MVSLANLRIRSLSETVPKLLAEGAAAGVAVAGRSAALVVAVTVRGRGLDRVRHPTCRPASSATVGSIAPLGLRRPIAAALGRDIGGTDVTNWRAQDRRGEAVQAAKNSKRIAMLIEPRAAKIGTATFR